MSDGIDMEAFGGGILRAFDIILADRKLNAAVRAEAWLADVDRSKIPVYPISYTHLPRRLRGTADAYHHNVSAYIRHRLDAAYWDSEVAAVKEKSREWQSLMMDRRSTSKNKAEIVENVIIGDMRWLLGAYSNVEMCLEYVQARNARDSIWAESEAQKMRRAECEASDMRDDVYAVIVDNIFRNKVRLQCYEWLCEYWLKVEPERTRDVK